MLVRDVMTSPAVTIRTDDEAAEAARVLDRLSLTSLPVVDRDLRLLGIISEADLISRLATAPADQPRVGDLMTRRVLTVSADDELSLVVSLMTGTILKSVPVLLRGRVVGMVSRRDIVRALAHGELDGSFYDELSQI
jgi:CBS-domain-containing membrane protein